MAEHFLFGTQPYLTNPSRVLLSKLLTATAAGGGISGGAADPVAAGTSEFQLYVNTTTGILFIWYSGAWH